MPQKSQMLSNMYTFNIAARFLSFTQAAEELFITQGAVSQRIKALEEQLGFSLFVRLTRRLELTTEGERLQHALNQSFDVIFSELDDIQFNELRGELYIGAAPTFAQRWLLPRLPLFQKKYPNLNVKLRVKASRLDFHHEPVDIAIYYSSGEHPDFYHQRLFEENLVPVCNPEYYEAHFSSEKTLVEQLTNVTFIHCSESLGTSRADKEWQVWLENQTDPAFKELDVMNRMYTINHSDMAMTAAKHGLGVAIARESLIEKSLQLGELVKLSESVSAMRGYGLICLKGQQLRPKNNAFIEWLNQQLLENPAPTALLVD